MSYGRRFPSGPRPPLPRRQGTCWSCGLTVEYRRQGGAGAWWVHVDTGTHRCRNGNDCNTRMPTDVKEV